MNKNTPTRVGIYYDRKNTKIIIVERQYRDLDKKEINLLAALNFTDILQLFIKKLFTKKIKN